MYGQKKNHNTHINFSCTSKIISSRFFYELFRTQSNYHECIRFTYELESDCSINFLDITIFKRDNNFIFKISKNRRKLMELLIFLRLNYFIIEELENHKTSVQTGSNSNVSSPRAKDKLLRQAKK